jgi:hypothetical protein
MSNAVLRSQKNKNVCTPPLQHWRAGVYSFYVLQEAHKEALCVLHADSVMVSKLEIKCHPRMIISKNNTAPPADSRHSNA